MKRSYTFCDVCKGETDNKSISMDVIFTTEQNEGRACPPYLSRDKLDLCDKCMSRIVTEGKYIFASGAMGYNDYRFK